MTDPNQHTIQSEEATVVKGAGDQPFTECHAGPTVGVATAYCGVPYAEWQLAGLKSDPVAARAAIPHRHIIRSTRMQPGMDPETNEPTEVAVEYGDHSGPWATMMQSTDNMRAYAALLNLLADERDAAEAVSP